MTKTDSKFGADPKPYYLAFAALALLELARRVFMDYIPSDFTAYLHAADLFVDGLDPYTDARDGAARYDGFPYNYVPGTLFLIAPMAWLPTPVVLGIDWVARCAAVFYASRVLHREIVPLALPHHFVLALLLFWEPLGIDLLFGNLVTYLFFGFAVALDATSSRRKTVWHWIGLVIAGIFIGFKPYWGIPIGYLALSRREWSVLAALFAGTAIVGVLSAVNHAFFETFLAHTEVMRNYYESIDLVSLAPMFWPPAFTAAMVLGLYFLFRGPREWVWILGCVSVVVWPRLATYSYVMMFPFMLVLVRRFGPLKGILASITMVGPLPWILRTLDYLPEQQEELWAHFIWTALMIPVALFLLVRWEPTAPVDDTSR